MFGDFSDSAKCAGWDKKDPNILAIQYGSNNTYHPDMEYAKNIIPFDAEMDPRLRPFLTPQDYRTTLDTSLDKRAALETPGFCLFAKWAALVLLVLVSALMLLKGGLLMVGSPPNDSCKSANDSKCDEPTHCDAMTDATDCGHTLPCEHLQDLFECQWPSDVARFVITKLMTIVVVLTLCSPCVVLLTVPCMPCCPECFQRHMLAGTGAEEAGAAWKEHFASWEAAGLRLSTGSWKLQGKQHGNHGVLLVHLPAE